MKVVILAGGLGTRIAEESDTMPKPMVEIGGMPILWHIMKIYATHGLTDFVICLGYRGYKVKEFFHNYYLHRSNVTFDLENNRVAYHETVAEPWRVTLVDTGEGTQVGGRIRRVLRLVSDDDAFCLTYGDGVGDVDITSAVAAHRASGRLATVTAVRPQGRFGSLHLDGDRVDSFKEKPEGKKDWINGGFFVLSPEVGRYIGGDGTVWEREPLEGLAADGELTVYRHEGFWHPLDTLRDKRVLEQLWATGDAPWKVW
jgi:glucose-1-phosphate cytidylyltransferase